MNKSFRVLSLDGGGVKGLTSAHILAELEERLGEPIVNYFDLVIGTSTGGLQTAMLRCGRYTASDLPGFYHEFAPEIFKTNWLRWIASRVYTTGYKYGKKRFRAALDEVLGSDTKLSDCKGMSVLTAWTPDETPGLFLFGSHRARLKGNAYDCRLVEAAEATASAPGFFEPAPVTMFDGRQYNLVDGGICCGSPALVGAIEAMNYGQQPTFVMSIGTGHYFKPARISGRALILSTGNIISETLRASSELVDYLFRNETDSVEYHLIDVPLDRKIEMDDASEKTLNYLDDVSLRYIDQNSDNLDLVVDAIKKTRQQ